MAMKNPPHPGRLIRDACLEPLGLTVTKAAAVLGVALATFASGRLCQGRFGRGHGWGGDHWPPQTLPLLVQPVSPIIARVGKQVLTTPEPTHAVGYGPLRPRPRR